MLTAMYNKLQGKSELDQHEEENDNTNKHEGSSQAALTAILDEVFEQAASQHASCSSEEASQQDTYAKKLTELSTDKAKLESMISAKSATIGSLKSELSQLSERAASLTEDLRLTTIVLNNLRNTCLGGKKS